MGSGGGGPKTPAPTEQEKALAKVGAEQWNDYATTYAGPGGVNEQFIEKVSATGGDKTAAAGQVGADAAIAAKQVGQGAARSGLGRGVSSSSGAVLASKTADSTSLASTKGRAQGMSVQGVDDAQMAADFKLASFGRGVASDAQVGLQKSTGRATDLVNKDAVANFKKKQALMEAVGTGIGMYAQTKDLFGKKAKPNTPKAGFDSSASAGDAYMPAFQQRF